MSLDRDRDWSYYLVYMQTDRCYKISNAAVSRKFPENNYILAITTISLIVGVGLPPDFSSVIANASALPKDFIF
jgi:hypothetical protein